MPVSAAQWKLAAHVFIDVPWLLAIVLWVVLVVWLYREAANLPTSR